MLSSCVCVHVCMYVYGSDGNGGMQNEHLAIYFSKNSS